MATKFSVYHNALTEDTTPDPQADFVTSYDNSATTEKKVKPHNIYKVTTKQGADIASAATITMGDGAYFHVTGVVTITALAFTNDFAGREVTIEFTGILTLTHNATSLILPTGANITTAAGDCARFKSEGSGNFRCVAYQRKDGTPLAGGGGGGMAIGGAVTSGTAGSVYFGGTAGALNQDNANFFWDDSGNKLGIGINSSLGGQIHSKAASGGVALVVDNTTAHDQLIQYNDAGVSRCTVSIDGNLGLKHFGAWTYAFFDSANQYFLISTGTKSSTDPATTSFCAVTTKPGHAVQLAAAQTADAYQVIDSGSNIIGAWKADASLIHRELITIKTQAASPYTVLNTECNTRFTNEGTSALVTFNLPTAVAGLTYVFYCADVDGVRVVANTGDDIRITGSVSATAGRIDSTVIGSCVKLTAINATNWIAEYANGTWVVT